MLVLCYEFRQAIRNCKVRQLLQKIKIRSRTLTHRYGIYYINRSELISHANYKVVDLFFFIPNNTYALGKNMTPIKFIEKNRIYKKKKFSFYDNFFFFSLPVPINDFNNKNTALEGVAVP